MKKLATPRSLIFSASVLCLGWASAATAQAQSATDQPVEADVSDDYGNRIVVIGSRRTDRTVADSPIPIDVIDSESLQNSGAVELNRLLNNLVPSFNFPQPSLTDGTDSLRPATLRGLSPDQVLVLVNGKRRHMSSLLNLNGSVGRGSAAVDLNTLPAIAIDQIEVLRDGASSLYGSDAIAGVINIQLKKRQGGRAVASYGKYITTLRGVDQVASVAPTTGASDNPVLAFTGDDRTQNDGDTFTLASNVGLPVGDTGYLNFTAEFRDRSPTNRSGPDIRRQYTAAGDPRESTISRYLHRFGDGQSQDFNFVINAGTDIGDWELYYFGTYGVRDANGAGFYRRANDARNRDFANGGRPFYPDGFLPLIVSEIRDISAAIGMRGDLAGFNTDLSVTYGSNRLNYNVENSFNTSLGGLVSQRRFDAGGLRSGQTSVNLDLQKDLDLGFGESISFAFGGEYRNENYKIIAGEPQSFVNGPFSAAPNNAPGGSQVFPGFRPENAVDASRDSIAGYVELDAELTKALTVQVAGRFENFSDFGNTLNGKFAARFEPIDGIALRGSVSTGFRAPGLAQQFFATTSTNNIGGNLVEVGTFPVESPVARALGSQPLDAEKSLNFGGGVSINVIQGLNLTVDYFNIKITDRITLTENLTGADVVSTLTRAGFLGVNSARFFINGIDTRTQGVDIVGSYRVPDFGAGDIRLTIGYNITDTDITDRRTFAGFTAQRLFARQESFRLTDGQPQNKLNLGLDWDYGIFGLTARTNRFGEVFLPSGVASPQRDDITVAIGDAPGDVTLTPKWITDLELRVNPSDAIEFAFGANNLFDVYPDRLPFGVVNGVNFGVNNAFLPYSSQSPFGFSGRFVYARLAVNF